MSVSIPYPKNALAPAISEQTLDVHERLWQKYNTTTAQTLNAIRTGAQTGNNTAIGENMEVLSFNSCGNLLHMVYFNNMKPGGSTVPGMQTLSQLAKYYGGLEQFTRAFSAAANQLRGPGWAILGWYPEDQQLKFITASLHNNNALFGFMPILVLDLWEHAYFLDYTDKRPEYITKWWSLVNWTDVERRLVSAMQGMSLIKVMDV